MYLMFEGGPKGGGNMARFNLSWLLKGKKTGDGELPAWIDAQSDLRPRTIKREKKGARPCQ